jgi:hypothetical protein
MKVTVAIPHQAKALRLSTPVLSRQDRKRASSWRVMGSTVSGFPAFRWQLSRNVQS